MLCVAGLALSGCTPAAHASYAVPVEVSSFVAAQVLPTVRAPSSIVGPLNGALMRRPLTRRPLAVIVDNYVEARPQSGLSQASVVVETLAEGGITRFMALYLEHNAPKVGPVRSSRVYFDRWAASFHAILVHVGGNDDAQDLLWHLPSVFNVDEGIWDPVFTDTCVYPFCVSEVRVAPYATYTNIQQIRTYAEQQHEEWPYVGASFLHKQSATMSQRGRSGSLSITFADPLDPLTPPNPDFMVRYDFDPVSDTYLRNEGGAPQIDAETNRPLRAANLVVIQTGPATADKKAGPTIGSILIPTVGEGSAWFFRDGTVLKGTWQQRDQFAPLQFFDEHGQEMALNPGQTWIEVLPKGSTTATWTFP